MRGRLHRLVDLGRHLVGIGGEPGPVDRDVAGRLRPDLRRAGLHRFAQIGHRIGRRVVDLDRLGAVLRRGEGLADHHGDRLADVAHALAGQRRADRHDQLGAAASRHRRVLRQIADVRRLDVGRGDDRDHALDGQRRLGVDRLDVGAGVRRADEAGIGLARQRRVGHVAAGAAQQIVVLDALAWAYGKSVVSMSARAFQGGRVSLGEDLRNTGRNRDRCNDPEQRRSEPDRPWHRRPRHGRRGDGPCGGGASGFRAARPAPIRTRAARGVRPRPQRAGL